MVGGSSKMPAIQNFVTDVTGAELSDAGIDPMTAIADEAAITDGISPGIITGHDFFRGRC